MDGMKERSKELIDGWKNEKREKEDIGEGTKKTYELKPERNGMEGGGERN